MADIPEWWVRGDWFDVCSCDIACPCEFAQPPTNNRCDGVLAYHVREGAYGDVRLDGLNVLGVAHFTGNLWAGEAKVSVGLFIDERASELQRQALQEIFSGQAGGFMAKFARAIGEMRGIEFVPISFAVADDLAFWSAEVPGKVTASAEALGGPMTPPGKRVQLSTHRAQRSDPDRSPHGARPPAIGLTSTASAGTGPASRANTSSLTGKVPPEANAENALTR
jgi:hypothetical protein